MAVVEARKKEEWGAIYVKERVYVSDIIEECKAEYKEEIENYKQEAEANRQKAEANQRLADDYKTKLDEANAKLQAAGLL